MCVCVCVCVYACAYVCTRVRVCASPSLPHTEKGWSDHYEPFYMYEREGGRDRGREGGWREMWKRSDQNHHPSSASFNSSPTQ